MKQEEECLFCGFTPYYHKIKRGGRSLWLVGDSKSSTDLSRNRNVFVCVVCARACACAYSSSLATSKAVRVMGLSQGVFTLPVCILVLRRESKLDCVVA